MVLAFSIGAALGSLYGAFILGPALDSIRADPKTQKSLL